MYPPAGVITLTAMVGEARHAATVLHAMPPLGEDPGPALRALSQVVPLRRCLGGGSGGDSCEAGTSLHAVLLPAGPERLWMTAGALLLLRLLSAGTGESV